MISRLKISAKKCLNSYYCVTFVKFVCRLIVGHTSPLFTNDSNNFTHKLLEFRSIRTFVTSQNKTIFFYWYHCVRVFLYFNPVKWQPEKTAKKNQNNCIRMLGSKSATKTWINPDKNRFCRFAGILLLNDFDSITPSFERNENAFVFFFSWYSRN